MYLTSFTSLNWAYQLHYYLGVRTHRRRESFNAITAELAGIIDEICHRHDYHLLKQQPQSDQLRCLVSLRPEHAVAKVIQILKTNSAREAGIQLGLSTPVWARGYLARSAGRVRIDAVRKYLEQQAQHHGYTSRLLPPVYCYRAKQPVVLTAQHSMFELDHHLVLATQRRVGVFTSVMGEALSQYWLRVAAKRGFAVDQVSVVPDHVHLMVRIAPKMSIEECALLLMNNGQYFMGQEYPERLIDAGIDQLWEASAYAGTCGKLTTAILKTWLSSE